MEPTGLRLLWRGTVLEYAVTRQTSARQLIGINDHMVDRLKQEKARADGT